MAAGSSRNGRTPDRDGDARQLRLVKWRAAGHSLPSIAARFGMSKARVAQLTDIVLKHDIAYSTVPDPVEAREPEAKVRAAYWRTGSGRRVTDAG